MSQLECSNIRNRTIGKQLREFYTDRSHISSVITLCIEPWQIIYNGRLKAWRKRTSICRSIVHCLESNLLGRLWLCNSMIYYTFFFSQLKSISESKDFCQIRKGIVFSIIFHFCSFARTLHVHIINWKHSFMNSSFVSRYSTLKFHDIFRDRRINKSIKIVTDRIVKQTNFFALDYV